jgi:adenosylhomocysteine nucleosidase
VDVPCVVFALGRESHFFRREYRPRRRCAGAPCRAWLCGGPAGGTVLLLETGIGSGRMTTALEWLLGRPILDHSPYQPDLIVSAGFSGALRPGLAVGDVVLATEVADLEGNTWPATWPAGAPLPHQGRLLTVPHLVSNPEEKRRLGREHAALAVDMETATLARLCSRHGVPFGCVRAISDDVDTALSPRLVTLLAGGQVSPWRVLAALAAAPRLVGELWRLARQTRRAARALSSTLRDLLILRPR